MYTPEMIWSLVPKSIKREYRNYRYMLFEGQLLCEMRIKCPAYEEPTKDNVQCYIINGDSLIPLNEMPKKATWYGNRLPKCSGNINTLIDAIVNGLPEPTIEDLLEKLEKFLGKHLAGLGVRDANKYNVTINAGELTELYEAIKHERSRLQQDT